MMLRIELKKIDPVYRPGEVIEGVAIWESNVNPGSMQICLNWHTEGKGDEDSETAFEIEWFPDNPIGRYPFRLTAPRAPLSLEGILVRICWELEFTSESTDDTITLPFVLSPWGHPIELAALPNKNAWFVN